ncbi:MAG: PorP/SprF family type IX secretion system membrane protein [Bacteroidales bacterium]|nr:PorP/SprF family type IX secretion system membrane protein [Bacteroidales bacterium]
MTKKLIIATVCMAAALSASAQETYFRGQNYADRFSVAPAFAGFNGNDEAFVSYRRNMLGIEGAPRNLKLDVNGDIMNQNAGYGIDITSEKSGNFTNLTAAITYAYHIKLGSEASLSLAVSPTLLRSSYNLAKATTFGAQTDQAFQNEAGLSAMAFDAGVSLMFNMAGLYFSANIPRTICGDMKFANGIYNSDRVFNGELSYQLSTGKFIIEPIADVSYALKGGLDYKASVAAKYNQRAWVTVSYSSQYWVGVGAGLATGSRVAVGYMFETGNSTIASNCSGTHEIYVGFCISKNQKRKEPTAFADDDCSASTPVIQNNNNSDLERKLQNEIRNRENEIKRLEDIINGYHSGHSGGETGYTTPTNNNTPAPSQPQPANNNSPEPASDEWKQPIPFNNVVFGYGNAKLFPSSNTELDHCVSVLKKHDGARVKIVAYTDELGSAEYCRILSSQRADAIKKYLVSKGIAESRIATEGKGRKMSDAKFNSEQRIGLNKVEYCLSKN